MDSSNVSLADFLNIPSVDIMGRAQKFYQFATDLKSVGPKQFKRVALEGSGPVRKVVDSYTGEIREMIYLSSNDYLNLTRHPKVVKAGMEALQKYGTGAGSVPLLGGTLDIHVELEKRVARFLRCEDAIIFPSGFASNVGALMALMQEEDVVITDMLVHASVIDGCKNTNIKYFKHNDVKYLENVLKRVKGRYRTKLIVVDGVYSMDGDIAPLNKIIEIAKYYGAYVMLDEAHATGVIGKNGRGTPEHFNMEGKVDIISGTFSKSLGGEGGFIASNKELVELLNFYSRTYMFSAAITPQAAASTIAAIDVVENEPEHRKKLWENIRYFRKGLQSLKFYLGHSEAAIFPIIIGDELRVGEMCRKLHERNIYVNPVLYPAVPKKLSRIRISMMSSLSKEHLDCTLNSLEDVGRDLGIIGHRRKFIKIS
ncbi:aminotransferase class I/II-fold pyridoxal phosphate-dependent enzyme [Acetivibrio cellulolyticus]|uniref:aminotransferase class I/II-fold pyridoxal phosphate-dependent enzyme n=1 Tax=Acetivibrio cellulolyticus TaxID=35830 RepID=UPI0001E2D932|nr:aminotransferase class I/II-fold pyridoxal phosphate-dependent enzyme [Acetivibrio cellulolyticus]